MGRRAMKPRPPGKDTDMDSEHVVSFMVKFARLKSWVDDPDDLVGDAIRDESVRNLCEAISSDAFWLKNAEKHKPALKAYPFDAGGTTSCASL